MNCNDLNIPIEQESDPCNGFSLSTECITHPDAITELNIPEGSTQQIINNAFYNAIINTATSHPEYTLDKVDDNINLLKEGVVVSTVLDATGGSSLDILDEGSNVVSNTSAINFIGANVVATDAGGGVANVTINGDDWGSQVVETDFTIDGDGTIATPLSRSGLIAVDEGNGVGHYLIGQDRANFGNIGLNAIDLGTSTSPSTTVGALGEFSFNMGEDNENISDATTVFGSNNIFNPTNDSGYHFIIGADNTFTNTAYTANIFSMGSDNDFSGYGHFNFGYNNTYTQGVPNGVGVNFGFGERHNITGYYTTTLGATHDVSGSYATTVGVAANVINNNTTGSTVERSLFTVGNGSVDANRNLISRSDAFKVFHSGKLLIPSYGEGNITGTATYGLGVDVDGNVIETALGGGGGGSTPSWQDTIDVDSSVSATDNTVQLNLDRYAGQIDFWMRDLSNTDNVITYGINDGFSPYFRVEGTDPDGFFGVDISGSVDINGRDGSVGLLAESIYEAEAQKRSAGLFLDIDDMLLTTSNPNDGSAAGLEFNGTNERVRLYKRASIGVENRFELQTPTGGGLSSVILPALNLPAFNDKYVPLYFTDGSTTVEADSTGLVNLSSLSLGGGGGSTYTVDNGLNENVSGNFQLGGELIIPYTQIGSGTQFSQEDHINLSLKQGVDGINEIFTQAGQRLNSDPLNNSYGTYSYHDVSTGEGTNADDTFSEQYSEITMSSANTESILVDENQLVHIGFNDSVEGYSTRELYVDNFNENYYGETVDRLEANSAQHYSKSTTIINDGFNDTVGGYGFEATLQAGYVIDYSKCFSRVDDEGGIVELELNSQQNGARQFYSQLKAEAKNLNRRAVFRAEINGIANTHQAFMGMSDAGGELGIRVDSNIHTPPASAVATGQKGMIRYDSNFLYLCTATNTWVRSPLTSW